MSKYQELVSCIETKSKRVSEILTTAKGRTDGAATKEELAEVKTLNADIEKLEGEAAELKAIADIEAKNDARIKAFNTPVIKPEFPNGGNQPGDEKKSYVPAYSTVSSLKHINVGTRQENEQLAYGFFNWFASTALRPGSPLQVKATQFCTDHGIGLKTLNEGNQEQGGALVPPEFDTMLIRLIETYGVFRRFTRMKPMVTETSTQPRRTGSVTAFWVGEAATITASNPTYDNVTLVAKKLAALTVMSSEINEDSALSIADQLSFEMGYAFSLSEDQAGFIGDASSTYGGISGITPKLKGLSGTIANIAGLFVGAGNAYSELTLADFNNTVGLLPQYADTPNTGWFVHKTFFHNVMQRLELAAGGVTANEISSGDRRPRPLFLGYPVNFTQVMPRTEANSQVCAIIGDLAQGTVMGDRRQRTMFTDPYSLSNLDQIRARCTERIDINFHSPGNADATAANRVPGPIVGLITAAS